MGINSNQKLAIPIVASFVGTLAWVTISKHHKNKTGSDNNTRSNSIFSRRTQKSEHENQEAEQSKQLKSKSPKKVFDKDGFDENGLDYLGYGRNGYNSDGVDRVGKTRQDYNTDFTRLQGTIDEAIEQLKHGAFTYALHDTRRVLEETLKQYVMHFCGKGNLGKSIKQNIEICRWKKLLSEDYAKKLHRARKICNIEHHEFDAQFEQQEVEYVVWLIQGFLEQVVDELICV